MIETDVKMALVNYRELRRGLKKAEDGIDEVNAKRFSCGGSIAKMPENPRPRDVIIIENLERLEKYRDSREWHKYLLELADLFIETLPEPYQSIVVKRYICNKSAESIGMEYGFSRATIYRIIDELIKQFVEQT